MATLSRSNRPASVGEALRRANIHYHLFVDSAEGIRYHSLNREVARRRADRAYERFVLGR